MDYTSPTNLQRLVRHVVDPVRGALEDGVERRYRALEALGTDRPDPWLESNLVRHVARARLEKRAPPNGWPWAIDRKVANSGIHLSTPDTRIRVAAGDVKIIPAPGPNRARRAFWAQKQPPAVQLPLPLFASRETGRLNLLLLWRPQDDDSVALTLAVPRDVWPFGSNPKLVSVVPLDDDQVEGEFDAGDDSGQDLVAEIHEEGDEEEEL